jgi:hypothetical protein
MQRILIQAAVFDDLFTPIVARRNSPMHAMATRENAEKLRGRAPF